VEGNSLASLEFKGRQKQGERKETANDFTGVDK